MIPVSLNLDLLYNYLIYSLNILRFVAFIRHEICVACEASPDQKLANVSQPVHFFFVIKWYKLYGQQVPSLFSFIKSSTVCCGSRRLLSRSGS